MLDEGPCHGCSRDPYNYIKEYDGKFWVVYYKGNQRIITSFRKKGVSIRCTAKTIPNVTIREGAVIAMEATAEIEPYL